MARAGRHKRRGGKWGEIPAPGPGATYRGYLRYSGGDDPSTTFAMQRREIARYAAARGWVGVGWDEEPAVSGAVEEIAGRPAFARHLADAVAGRFAVSLAHMSDRWARDTEIALGSLKRLRRAGVYWATADGHWDINSVIADGHSVAWVVDAEINASYARKQSAKARAARRERAHAGYHNGRLCWGYTRGGRMLPPEDAPANWRPPRVAARPHPEDFARLQQLGAWAATGLSDRQLAARAAAASWTLAHPHTGVVPWTKSFVAELLTNPFPREFAPGSGHGTILAPDGERVEGKHLAAWSWDLWHRMDAQRAANRKGRRAHPPTESAGGLVRVFSGVAVCAACGRALQHQARVRVGGPRKGARYSVYRCAGAHENADERVACALRRNPTGGYGARGWVGIAGARLDVLFAEALLAPRLPDDWRARIAAAFTAEERDEQEARASAARRQQLEAERARVLFQHQSGWISDAAAGRELARLGEALAALPSVAGRAEARVATLEAGETLARFGDYWAAATAEERAEMVRLMVRPGGLVVDLASGPPRAAGRITRVRPQAALLPVLRLALTGWRLVGDGWLVRDAGDEGDDVDSDLMSEEGAHHANLGANRTTNTADQAG